MSLEKRLTKLKRAILLGIKTLTKNPDEFIFVEQDENGKYIIPEGFDEIREYENPISVEYPTFHDSRDYNINMQMTKIRYLEQLNVNGVYVYENSFEKIIEGIGKITIQPLILKK